MQFHRLFRKAEPEPLTLAPVTLTDPMASWLFGAIPTHSNVSVTPKSAMQVPAVSSAVELIAEAVGTLPVKLFVRNAKGKEADPAHAAFRLAHDEANDWTSAAELRTNLTHDAMLHDRGGFALANRLADGRVFEFVRLDPLTVDPKTDEITGEPFYVVRQGRKNVRYEYRDVLHIQAFGASAPVNRARNAIALAIDLEQRDAAAELITKLEDELRLIGENDLEQRVNAELRRAGAGASDAQKASIRQLVTEIETETDAMARLEEASDNAKGVAKDFLGGIIGDLRSGVDGATALANAFGRLADKLLDMALDTLINSLFENMMGGAGGGLLGGIFGFSNGGVVEAATGGLIRGPGTGTSDSIPARLSNGEFVVNAAATRRNMDVLRAINDGKIAAFASGGLVGDTTSLRAANQNVAIANDNAAPVLTINAPITVNGSSGTPEQNADLAKQMGKQLEGTVRTIVVNEIQKQQRPGNILSTRSR